MKILSKTKLDSDDWACRLTGFKQSFHIHSYLSFLPQLWQSLLFPENLKNGNHILLSEKITSYNLVDPVTFSKVTLYLMSERFSHTLNQHIVYLELRIYQKKKILARVKITLLSEEPWNENYHTD